MEHPLRRLWMACPRGRAQLSWHEHGETTVRRLVLGLATGVGLIAAVLPAGWAAATAGGSLQMITSPSGYQFQVPSDWQQLPLSMQERVGPQTFADDGEVASADGVQHAHVETATGFGITADTVQSTLSSFLSGSGGAPGAISAPAGGGPGAASAPAGPGGAPPALTLYATPSSVTVANADAADAGAATYTDPDGNTRVLAARLAIRGNTSYLLLIDSTQDFYKNNSALGQIENSFQLVSGSVPTSGASTTPSSLAPSPAVSAP